MIHGDTAMCGHSQEDSPELLSLIPGYPASQRVASCVYQTLAERISLTDVANVRKHLSSFFLKNRTYS